MIYLDNAASTQISDEVLQEMLPYLKENYGNPSSIHRFGRVATKAIETARKRVADLIGAQPSEILFTSGGTESNNTALFGIVNAKKGQVITSSVEHDAILEPCKKLESQGCSVIYLPVDNTATVDVEELKSVISKETLLVSIMYANNEVGTIQPIKEIAQICKQYAVPFHTDAVQAAGKVPVNVKELGVDLMSVSSHKINGPKGVGALYIRSGLKIDPYLLGGGQESGLRSGTENVANIVGFGKACQLAKENLDRNTTYLRNLRDTLVDKVTKEISHVTLNGHKENRLPNNAHFTFLGVNGEDLIIKLDENGIAASTGSACSVKTQKASHVLAAMGFSHEQITGSLRLTVGLTNTPQEIEQTVDALKKIVSELRAVSPFKTKYGFAN
ncbi:MAG TPA: cysteine desulfurase family protein [Candidatus Nitrosotenuis sp.]|nr:cysteine desulfurase family protein [Candidatus Nitrosotenuis sp.]